MSNYQIRNTEFLIRNGHGAVIGKFNDVSDFMFTFESPRRSLKVQKLIFNPPATIVYWNDGTKTVVKAQEEDFDEEKGFAMAYMKKTFGDWSKYDKIIENAQRNSRKVDNIKTIEINEQVKDRCVKESKLKVEDFLNKKVAIHCKTEELAEDFVNRLDELSYKWANKDGLRNNSDWNEYRDETCYTLATNGVLYSDLGYYQRNDYEIIEFQGW